MIDGVQLSEEKKNIPKVMKRFYRNLQDMLITGKA